MKSWLLSSLAVHLLLLGAVIAWHARRPAPKPELLVATPIGGVFVREEARSEAPRVNLPEVGGTAPAPAAAPSEATLPGVPDGEASTVGNIQPAYPPLSRRMGEEGEAAFVLEISVAGTVTSVALEKSTGHTRLDEAARNALLAARFQPATRAGVPVPSQKRITIEFRLKDH